MSRPRARRPISADDITAEIESENLQLSLLRADLEAALLAGEKTQSYRAAIAGIEKSISALSANLETLSRAEVESRRVRVQAEGREISAVSFQRLAALANEFLPPSPPSILTEFCQ